MIIFNENLRDCPHPITSTDSLCGQFWIAVNHKFSV